MDSELLHSIVNASGFPFQIRIATEIKRAYKEHRWVLESEERLWQDSGNEGFADLVLRKTRSHPERSTMYLVVECKRVTEGAWVFLRPSLANLDEHQSDRALLAGSSLEPAWWPIFWADEREIQQSDYPVAYCAVPKRRPPLERTAGELVRATEGVAKRYHNFMINRTAQGVMHPAVFFPLLVTNTPLFVCEFEVEQVSLERGELPYENAEFRPVDFVRFRKSFRTLPVGKSEANTMERVDRENQRTVWIVQGVYLAKFLKEWNVYFGAGFPTVFPF